MTMKYGLLFLHNMTLRSTVSKKYRLAQTEPLINILTHHSINTKYTI